MSNTDTVGVTSNGEGGAPAPAAEVQTPIALDRISTAPVEVPGGGGDLQAQREKESLAHERAQFLRELGWLGLPFGGRKEKPGNISALVISLSFLIIIVALVAGTAINVMMPDKHIEMPISFEKLLAGITSLITLALGYLFGSNDKGEK